MTVLFERQSDSYRRGLTLGLTMAEIFILVVFMLLLMLLAMSAFNSKSKEALARTQEALTVAVDERDKARRQIPESIEPLVRKNESLERDLKTAKEEASKKAELLEKAQQEIKNTKRDNDQFRAESHARIEPLVRKNESLERDLKTAKEEASKTAESLEKAQQKNESLEKAIDHLGDKLHASKGIDPTCWYQVEYPQGKRREKPYYLMGIAVHDDHLQVCLPPSSPPGAATYVNGERASTSYDDEYKSLPLAPFRPSGDMLFTTFAKNAEFAKNAKPIRSMGENKEIRDYACKFYVNVWDKTGPNEKERWKKATAAIKDSFYVYEVQNDPWPCDAGK